jgi:hypothetical protein
MTAAVFWPRSSTMKVIPLMETIWQKTRESKFQNDCNAIENAVLID